MKNAANVSLFIHRADWNRLSKKAPPRLLSFYQEMQEYAHQIFSLSGLLAMKGQLKQKEYRPKSGKRVF